MKVSVNERAILVELFDAIDVTRAANESAKRDLSIACRMILTREGIQRATVDDLDGDELVLTVDDPPKELQDADRAAETPRTGPNARQGES